MILLDTNVVSEASKPVGHPDVRAWLDAQIAETLYLSAITVAELLFGIAILPEGRRKRALEDNLRRVVLPVFEGRILHFDAAAAEAYARIRAHGRATGKAIETVDGYIAAIAEAHQLTVATRDTGPFIAAGLTVIDPWTA
ncbi:type II toxin-antitoxin system VapC family toxin [Bosea sp. PAMC 26642]|uniref:type II toxin-antitoxin system VapC family toxin n=1 Tax=Bosea sp. (strain PAMC 26642) TaxID=1792307 RepID=UPI0007703CF4|nr:type II toxin-antitoxin system VapC family toxin [Bosea sp. PAMC 26642]AMJ60830.1 plasmid stability protein StbB [Bosea sp. PAMC 26642]